MEGSGLSAARHRPRWGVWTLWCGFAEVIGMFSAAGAAVIGARLVGEPRTLAAAGVVLVIATAGGAIEGLAVGGIQYRLLKPWLRNLSSRRFIGATVTVAVAAWLIGMLPSTLASLLGSTDAATTSEAEPSAILIVAVGLVGGAVAGAIFGGAQAWALNGVVTRPSTWVVANIAAWTLAMAVIMIGATTPSVSWSVAQVLFAGVLTGLLAGSVLGAVTGLFLPRLVPVFSQRVSDASTRRSDARRTGGPH